MESSQQNGGRQYKRGGGRFSASPSRTYSVVHKEVFNHDSVVMVVFNSSVLQFLAAGFCLAPVYATISTGIFKSTNLRMESKLTVGYRH